MTKTSHKDQPRNPSATARSDSLALLMELVERQSVTPEDAGCQALIADRLSSAGFTVETMNRGGVDNLWARRGDSAPLLAFAGHTDVVPSGEPSTWTYPPFRPSIKNGLLYGRGAADMKGSVAAMVTALERFAASGKHRFGSIALLLTSDEEGPAIDGTRHVIDTLEARGEHIDRCILGEPSSSRRLGDTLRNGRRGSLSARLTVRGIQGHVAYPDLADNPVHRSLAALDELCRTEWDQGNQDFPPTTLQISNAHAGTGATNVIPGTFSVDFNLRYGTASDADDLRARIAAIFDRHGLDVELDWTDSARPFVTERGFLVETVVDVLRQRTGLVPVVDTAGGTSDGRFIVPTGTELIEFGPVNATIHQVDECIDIADLDTLSQIYEDILTRLAGSSRTPS